MNNAHSAKTTLKIVFGTLLFAWIIVLIPTPIHEWFVEASIVGIPLDVIALALSIMFTPPFILSTLLRNFDVDYADEVPAPAHASQQDIAIHTPIQANHL